MKFNSLFSFILMIGSMLKTKMLIFITLPFPILPTQKHFSNVSTKCSKVCLSVKIGENGPPPLLLPNRQIFSQTSWQKHTPFGTQYVLSLSLFKVTNHMVPSSDTHTRIVFRLPNYYYYLKKVGDGC